MGDNTKLQYIVELLTQGDTAKARDEFDKLKTSAKGAGESVNALSANATTLFAALGGVALIHQSVEAFIEQEKAIAKLNAALKSTNQFTPELSKQMIELSKAMAQTSLFADEAILNVIAKLTAMGAKTQDVQRLTRATLDLATLMDGDLNQAARQMALAIGGAGAAAFDRLRLNIDSTLTATEGMNAALLEIEKRAGGQSQAQIETLGGKFEMMTKQVNELKAALGGLTLSGLVPYMEMVSTVAKHIDDFIDSHKKLFEVLGTIGNLVTPGMSTLTAAKLIRPPPTAPSFPLTPESNAALMKAAGLPRAVGSGPLDDADRKAFEDEQDKKSEDIFRKRMAEFELQEKAEVDLNKQEEQYFQDWKEGAALKRQFTEELTLLSLSGADREAAQIEIHHQERMRQIGQQRFATVEAYQEAFNAENKLYEAELKRATFSQQVALRLEVDLRDLAAQGIQLFAGGLAGAIVSAFEEGDKAFQKFAQRFLKAMAEMILQTLILKAIQSVLGGGGQVSSGGGGAATTANIPQLAGAGGWFAGAIRAAGGVDSVSSPTYFPKFNVLAGEAGREVMTVLAQPRMVNFGGLSAQVGMAGSNRLAITSADALAARAGGGAGGTIDIRVTMSPGLKAEIVSSSVKGARLTVIQDLNENSAISRGVKALTA